MCNFVPRECIAFGPLGPMEQLIQGWIIPGVIHQIPLLPEGIDYGSPTPFDKYGFLHVTNIPEGLEVLTVSKLSAALRQLIEQDKAVVELNAYLPFGSGQQYRRNAFSPVTNRLLNRLRRHTGGWVSGHPTLAVLDSGVDPGALRTHEPLPQTKAPMSTRRLIAIDYLNEKSPRIVDPHDIGDPLAHGSVVCRILDTLLPHGVSLAVGRVAARSSDVTVLYLARCYAHMVATQKPDVVNLSLSPLRDYIFCPDCDGVVPVDGFHTLILPRVFSLASKSTWTVMAAGNKGRGCNADHFLAENERLVYATALNSSGQPADYSNYLEGDKARSLAAFGGDPIDAEGGQGILTAERRVVGTSFAAPFVSALIWAKHTGTRQPDEILDECRSLLAEVHGID